MSITKLLCASGSIIATLLIGACQSNNLATSGTTITNAKYFLLDPSKQPATQTSTFGQNMTFQKQYDQFPQTATSHAQYDQAMQIYNELNEIIDEMNCIAQDV